MALVQFACVFILKQAKCNMGKISVADFRMGGHAICGEIFQKQGLPRKGARSMHTHFLAALSSV